MGWVKNKGGSKVPVSNGSTRSVKKYAGGGEVGFDSIGNKAALLEKLAAATSGQNPMESIAPPMENTVPPMYKKGGKTKSDKGLFGVEGGVFSEAGKKRRAARKAARQAKRSKKVVEGKNIIGAKKDMHVYKEGEYSGKDGAPKYDVAYAHTGSKSKQQVKVVKDGKAKALAEKTKGGDYKVYGKKSKKAKSYREAFSAAMKKGEGTQFTWDGQKHVAKYAKKKK